MYLSFIVHLNAPSVMYYQIVVIGVFILSAINVEINHLLSSINGHYMTIYLQNINTIILRKTGKKE